VVALVVLMLVLLALQFAVSAVFFFPFTFPSRIGIHQATNGFCSVLCFSSSVHCGDHLHSIFPETEGAR
jgi:hypothetical protein